MSLGRASLEELHLLTSCMSAVTDCIICKASSNIYLKVATEAALFKTHSDTNILFSSSIMATHVAIENCIKGLRMPKGKGYGLVLCSAWS